MLITFFKNIPDKRRKQGQMYDLEHLLLFTVLAILSGATSYRKVHTFIKSRFKLLKKDCKLKWRKSPAYTTIRNILQSLESNSLEKAFRAYSKTLTENHKQENDDAKEIRCISFDGKVVRGSFDNFEDQDAIQVLSSFFLKKDIVLAHEEIEKKKTNEIPVVQKLINELGLKDCVFVFDALHCQKKH